MKYNCSQCKYATDDKSNFNKHIKSTSHTPLPSSVNIGKHTSFVCQACNKVYSSKQSLSRHRLHYCTVIQNQDNSNYQYTMTQESGVSGLLNENNELKEQVSDLSNQVKVLIQMMSENKMVPINNTTNNTNNTTNYNLSVKNYIQKKYPNAPALKGVTDYSQLLYKNYTLMDTLVYNYENNNLHKYIGNFIIKCYKKDNPAEQSMCQTTCSLTR